MSLKIAKRILSLSLIAFKKIACNTFCIESRRISHFSIVNARCKLFNSCKLITSRNEFRRDEALSMSH